MSYCRMGDDSEVYLYQHVDGGYQLHIAGMASSPIRIWDADEMAFLLRILRRANVKVPQRAIDRLDADWEATGRDRWQEEVDFWEQISDMKKEQEGNNDSD